MCEKTGLRDRREVGCVEKNAEAYSPADSSDDRRPRGRPLKRRADDKSYRMIVKLQQDICAEKRAKDR